MQLLSVCDGGCGLQQTLFYPLEVTRGGDPRHQLPLLQ